MKKVNKLIPIAVTVAFSALLFGSSITQAADLSKIKEAGVLKVVTEDDYPPFEYIERGEKKGFHKDVIDELNKYSKDFSVKQKIMPWTGLLASVSTGQYDIAITAALITDERLKKFDFVAPIASAQHFYIKRTKDDSINAIADLNGKTVGVQAGSAMLTRLPELAVMLAKTGGKLGDVVEYQSYPEIYADLANGRLDYAVNAIIPLNDLLKKRSKIFSKGQAVSGHGFVGWPVIKGSDELVGYLNNFVKHLKDTGKLKELQMKWFGESFDDLPQETIKTSEQFHKLANLN